MSQFKHFAGDYTLRKRNRYEEEHIYKQRPDSDHWIQDIYNPEHNEVFGLNPFNWMKVILYYIIFIAVVVALSIGYYFLYVHYFVPEGKPKYTNDQPGLSYAPLDISGYEQYSDMILNINPTVEKIRTFLETKDNHDMSRFDECNNDGFFGYASRQPCVFIKINRISNFKPVTYDTLDSLPKNAPEKLKTLVKEYGEGKKIWLLCDSTDINVVPNITYVPSPYWVADSLMDNEPMVITRDNNPLIVPAKHKRIIGIKLNNVALNVKMSIICTAWARNIKLNENEVGTGWLSFEVNTKQTSKKE